MARKKIGRLSDEAADFAREMGVFPGVAVGWLIGNVTSEALDRLRIEDPEKKQRAEAYIGELQQGARKKQKHGFVDGLWRSASNAGVPLDRNILQKRLFGPDPSLVGLLIAARKEFVELSEGWANRHLQVHGAQADPLANTDHLRRGTFIRRLVEELKRVLVGASELVEFVTVLNAQDGAGQIAWLEAHLDVMAFAQRLEHAYRKDNLSIFLNGAACQERREALVAEWLEKELPGLAENAPTYVTLKQRALDLCTDEVSRYLLKRYQERREIPDNEGLSGTYTEAVSEILETHESSLRDAVWGECIDRHIERMMPVVAKRYAKALERRLGIEAGKPHAAWVNAATDRAERGLRDAVWVNAAIERALKTLRAARKRPDTPLAQAGIRQAVQERVGEGYPTTEADEGCIEAAVLVRLDAVLALDETRIVASANRKLVSAVAKHVQTGVVTDWVHGIAGQLDFSPRNGVALMARDREAVLDRLHWHVRETFTQKRKQQLVDRTIAAIDSSPEEVGRVPVEEIARDILRSILQEDEADARKAAEQNLADARRRHERELVQTALIWRFEGHALIRPEAFRHRMKKAEVGALLGYEAKALRKYDMWALIGALCHRLDRNKVALREFYNDYGERLALHPLDTERALGITQTERRRWTEEGWLAVSHYERLHKYGRTLEVPWYDAWAIHHIKPAALARWRASHDAATAKHRAAGQDKAKLTRARNKAAREAAKQAIEARRRSWAAGGDLFAVAVLELALWTLWSSRWAKTDELRARRALRYGAKYRQQSEAWYALKNRGIALLSQTPFSKLSVYVPENPHKIRVSLCHYHLEEFREQRSFGFVERAWEYVADNQKRLTECGNCVVNKTPHFYSLYYTEVSVPGLESERFSFHTPVPIGVDFLGPIRALPRVGHAADEGWGEFRFGRAMSAEELVVYPEGFVRRHMEAALERIGRLVDGAQQAAAG